MSQSAMAKVFVGIPTRNRPQYLKQAVESVLAQSYQDFRVFVSDNCSTPDASAAVEAYLEGLDDPRVRYHRQSRDTGEYGQGRFLLGQCTETYFVLLHDDDRFEPDFLEFAVKTLDSDPEVDFLSTAQYLFDEHGELLARETVERKEMLGRNRLPEGVCENVLEVLLESGGIFSVSGCVLRTTSVRRFGLVDDDLWGLYPFEFNVFLRQGEHGARAYCSPREMVGYRWHGNSQQSNESRHFNKVMVGMLITLLERRRFEGRAEASRRRLLSYTMRNYGFIMYVAGDRRACYRFLLQAIRYNPLSARVWAYLGFAVLCPFLIPRIWGPRVRLRLMTMEESGQGTLRLDLESPSS